MKYILFIVLSIIYVYLYEIIMNLTIRACDIITHDYVNPFVNVTLENFKDMYSNHKQNEVKVESVIKEEKNDKVQILTYSTCPICYNIFDKIYMCRNGHSICSRCLTTSTTCPFCKEYISSNTRNRVFECVLQSIQLPCSYYKYGCEKCVTIDEREKHEKVCKYRPLKCYICNGYFESDYINIIKHIKNTHTDVEILKNNFEIKLNKNIDNHNTLYKVLIKRNKIIFLKCAMQKDLNISLLGDSKVKFTIEVYSNKDSDFGKYVLNNTVKPSVECRNTLTIPHKSIKYLKCDSFYCDINICK